MAAAVREGNSITLTVSVEGDIDAPASVRFVNGSGTATKCDDFEEKIATLEIDAANRTASVSVQTTPVDTTEGTGTLVGVLFGAQGIEIGIAQATDYIIDD